MKTIKRWLSIPCLLLAGFLLLCLAACKPDRAETNGTPTATILLPTPSRTPVPSKTPTPTITPEISLKEIETLGKGILPSIVHSPDGKSIVTCDGQTIRWLNADDYSERASFQGGCAGEIIFSPDSRLIVVFLGIGQSIIDLETQKTLASFGGGNGAAVAPAFFPDSKSLVYLGTDRSTGGPYHFIGFVDIAKGETRDRYSPLPPLYRTLHEYRYHTLTGPAVSPDGSLVAAGYSDSTNNILYIWDSITGATLFEIKEQPSHITSVAFSPDGSTLASAGYDGIVRLWNPATGQTRRTITGFSDSLRCVEFSPDGRQLIVSITNQSSVVYDLATGKITPQEEPAPDPLAVKMLQEGYLLPGGGSKILFSPDGKNVAVAHGSVQVWNISSGELVAAFQAETPLAIIGMVFSKDGNHLAVITNSGDVYSWNIPTQRQELHLSADALLTSGQVFYAAGGGGLGPGIGSGTYGEKGIAFSPDGKRLALGNGVIVEVWDIPTASKVMTLEQTQPLAIPTAVSYSDDGKYIFAILNRNVDAAMWDAATGKLIEQLNLPTVDPNAFTAIALDGSLFARNNYDDENYWIELWNLETGKMTKLPMPTREVEPLRFNTDGSLIMAINNNRIYVWRTDTGVLAFVTDAVFEIGDFAISSDGEILATADYGKVSLWDISPYVQASFQPGFTPPAPPPTETPWFSSDSYDPSTPTPFPWTSGNDYSTWTPQPTHEITATPRPSSLPGVIVAENASQVKQLAQFGSGTISNFSWSPINGRIIVSSSQGSYQFSAVDLAEREHFDTKSIWVTSSRVLPDGRWLVAGFTNDDKIQVWDAARKNMLVQLNGGGQPAISPDGKWVVYVEPTKGLATWNLETGQPGTLLLSTWSSSSWPVFSPDSKLVAAIQSDSSVRVWDLATGTIVNAVGGPEADITDMSFSQDGNWILGAAGGSAWVWSIVPGQIPLKLTFDEGTINGNLTLFDTTVTAIAMSPDSSLIAIGTSKHKVWFYNRNTKQMQGTISNLSGIPNKLAFSPDSTQLASTDRDGRIVIWEVGTQHALVSSHIFGYSALGLVNRVDGDVSAWAENTVWVIDPANASLKQTTYIPSGKILAVSPAGDLAAAYSPLRVSLYNAQTGTLVHTLPEEAEDVWVEYYWEGQILRQFYGALFSPDGKHLATLGAGGVWMYEMPEGKLVSHLEGNNARKAAFSPDGQMLVVSGFEQSWAPQLIKFQSGTALLDLEFPIGDYRYTMGKNCPQYSFSPDGLQIGILANVGMNPATLLIAETISGRLSKQLSLEDVKFTSLAFSPGATIVAVGHADGHIVLIESNSMTIVATLDAHKGSVDYLTFSKDGRTLISTGTDGVVKVWGLP